MFLKNKTLFVLALVFLSLSVIAAGPATITVDAPYLVAKDSPTNVDVLVSSQSNVEVYSPDVNLEVSDFNVFNFAENFDLKSNYKDGKKSFRLIDAVTSAKKYNFVGQSTFPMTVSKDSPQKLFTVEVLPKKAGEVAFSVTGTYITYDAQGKSVTNNIDLSSVPVTVVDCNDKKCSPGEADVCNPATDCAGSCKDANDCEGGKQCIAGLCSGGGKGETCTAGSCDKTKKDPVLECKIKPGEKTGTCEPKTCTEDKTCDPLKCVIKAGQKVGECTNKGCSKDAHCTSPKICDLTQNTCIDKKCKVDADCGGKLKCDPVKLICVNEGDEDGDGVPDALDKCPKTPTTMPKTKKKRVVYPTSIKSHAGCIVGDLLGFDNKIDMADVLEYGTVIDTYMNKKYDGPGRVGSITFTLLNDPKATKFKSVFDMSDVLQMGTLVDEELQNK